jgi:hypothetical protein
MIVNRVGIVIFGVVDSKMKLLSRRFQLQDLKPINHYPMINPAILEKDRVLLMRIVFAVKREGERQHLI